MRIAIAADHGGFVLKSSLLAWIESLGHQVEDLGAYVFDSRDDYPDYAKAVSEAIVTGKADRGIIICGSGVGAAIAANKIKDIRACLCHDTFSAHQGVEHDDMNVLCLGGRILGIEMAKELISAFLNATFIGDQRYTRRVEKIKDLEDEASKDTSI